jgi:CubicO group peptidase (beta-lactamase class C family)
MFARLWALAAVVLIATGCGASTGAAPRSTPADTPLWERATLDPQVAAKADQLARTRFKGITSVLVARHGRLALERYYGGLEATDQVPVFSVTKTFISALVGVALAEGRLRSVHQRLGSILPETHSRITLRQLLTMTAGFGRSLNFQESDPAALANRPRVNPPGETFNYDSGSSDLLAAVLERATGMPAARYAELRLFAPLGIRGARWPGSRGGSGLILRPRELLAFGQLYLDGGLWRGRRVIAKDWVHTSTRVHVRVPLGSGASAGYGYNWWIGGGKRQFFAAHGYLGQALVIFPKLDSVVVVTSSREDIETGFALARVIGRALH